MYFQDKWLIYFASKGSRREAKVLKMLNVHYRKIYLISETHKVNNNKFIHIKYLTINPLTTNVPVWEHILKINFIQILIIL